MPVATAGAGGSGGPALWAAAGLKTLSRTSGAVHAAAPATAPRLMSERRSIPRSVSGGDIGTSVRSAAARVGDPHRSKHWCCGGGVAQSTRPPRAMQARTAPHDPQDLGAGSAATEPDHRGRAPSLRRRWSLRLRRLHRHRRPVVVPGRRHRHGERRGPGAELHHHHRVRRRRRSAPRPPMPPGPSPPTSPSLPTPTEGAHTISAVCDSEGNVSSTDVSVTVSSSVASPGGPLASTGSDSTEPLVVAGVLALLRGRRLRDGGASPQVPRRRLSNRACATPGTRASCGARPRAARCSSAPTMTGPSCSVARPRWCGRCSTSRGPRRTSQAAAQALVPAIDDVDRAIDELRRLGLIDEWT